MNKETKRELIDYIRNNTISRKVPTYNIFGVETKKTLLPIFYSDTFKLLYPEEYFTQFAIDEIVDIIEDYITKNNLPLKVIMTKNENIAALHTKGWKIQVKE